ncbi:MAG: magnesium transporter [Acidobacteriota bacterium]|nr:magnesium transporter [Acidobacteriota bacterium]MDT5262893.1 magnesium transporter [Acidobacteriota bacterium]MDT7777737.1 magnesium transporter [Acidobacteriota bacterium]
MDFSSRTVALTALPMKDPSSGKAPKRLRFLKRPSQTAPTQPAAAQLTVLIRRPGADRPEHLPPERISDELREPGVLLWVDIRDPGPSELAMLNEEFDFSPLSLEDALKQRQRPKVDEFPSYYFIVMYAPLASTGQELRVTEIDLFVGENFVVSLHPGHVPALDLARRRWETTEPDLRDRVGFLAHIVVDAIVDACFPIVDDMDERLHRLEEAMFHGNRGANPEELLMLKRSVFALRMSLYPLRDAFQAFPKREQALFDLETHPYFQDVYDHVLRLLDIIDIQQEMVAGATEAHLAFMSNQLNETMKTLTVVGICEAAGAAVFGAWGMNVSGLPLAHARIGNVDVGFWLVCLLTMGLIALALLWLKRRGIW